MECIKSVFCVQFLYLMECNCIFRQHSDESGDCIFSPHSDQRKIFDEVLRGLVQYRISKQLPGDAVDCAAYLYNIYYPFGYKIRPFTRFDENQESKREFDLKYWEEVIFENDAEYQTKGRRFGSMEGRITDT